MSETEGIQIERRLLAVIIGDIAGYSRLVAEQEDATITRLHQVREIVNRAIVSCHGRLVDFTGDNFLAEFGSATHAIDGALRIQRECLDFNEENPAAPQVTFRIGAHLGDVSIEGERLFGDAVNIASRLEGLAEAGGVCFSKPVRDQIVNRVDVVHTDLGPQSLKNIDTPIHAYQISAAAVSGRPETTNSKLRKPDKRNDSTSISRIAVLPFASLSPDPDQAYIVDGMTSDIISGLSCDKRFSVVSENSVAQFTDTEQSLADVAETLSADYIVTGKVRHLGHRLRISMALNDIESNREIWGDHYDRSLDDLFDVFDELIEAIVTALASHLRLADEARFKRRKPQLLEAWALATQASSIYFRNPTLDLEATLNLIYEAIRIDPEYAYAWAVGGFLTALKFPLGTSYDHDADVKESHRLADQALALDPADPWNLFAKAVALQYEGRPTDSMQYLQRSLRMNPSDVFVHCYYGRGLMFSGNPTQAIAHFERFDRLNPNDPGAHMPAMYHSIALSFLQRWEEAEQVAKIGLAASGGRNPWLIVMLMIASGALNNDEQVKKMIEELKRVAPQWDRAFVEQFFLECQDDKSLLEPMFMILHQIWP